MLARSRHAVSANLVDLQEMAGHPRHRGQQGSHALTHSLLGIVKHYLATALARALVDNHQMSDCCPVMLFCWPSYFSKTGLSLIHGNHRKLVHGEDV